MNEPLNGEEFTALLTELGEALKRHGGDFEVRASVYFPATTMYPPYVAYRLTHNWRYYDLTLTQYRAFNAWLFRALRAEEHKKKVKKV